VQLVEAEDFALKSLATSLRKHPKAALWSSCVPGTNVVIFAIFSPNNSDSDRYVGEDCVCFLLLKTILQYFLSVCCKR
jgi:hypothetical protein